MADILRFNTKCDAPQLHLRAFDILSVTHLSVVFKAYRLELANLQCSKIAQVPSLVAENGAEPTSPGIPTYPSEPYFVFCGPLVG